MRVIIPAAYVPRRVNGRTLLVPTRADRELQQELYQEIKHLRPLSLQPDKIQEDIRTAFKANPNLKALRTDIKSCFPSIPANVVIAEIDKLATSDDNKQSLKNVVTAAPKGLPMGSPLSPWLAELALKDIDAAMAGTHYFRYVDDICVLAPTELECQAALSKLEAATGALGMQLNKAKTEITDQTKLVFIGRSFEELEDTQLLEVNLGGDSFKLPNGKSLFFRVNLTGKPYNNPEGNPTYNISNLLKRMLEQPTPQMLEMLMLKPACSHPDLQVMLKDPTSIIDQGTPYALHGKIYRHYVNQVKPKVEKGVIPIGEAGEVYRWLYLTNTIMQTGKVPENYQPLEDEWAEILVALEANDYKPYHTKIKAMFKLEHALKAAPPIQLPKQKSAIAMSIE